MHVVARMHTKTILPHHVYFQGGQNVQVESLFKGFPFQNTKCYEALETCCRNLKTKQYIHVYAREDKMYKLNHETNSTFMCWSSTRNMAETSKTFQKTKCELSCMSQMQAHITI